MNSIEALSVAPGLTEHRSRLLQAMAVMAADKGLANTTIADIVREAGVSKRTFYEHFAGKEDCFLSLYRAASASAVRTLQEASVPDQPWQAQVEHTLGAYFAHLAAGPRLLRALFVEVHHLGPEGLSVRREVMQQLADLILARVQAAAVAGESHGTGEAGLSPSMAMAAVGAIHELVLQAIERHQEAQLAELTPAAAAIVRALARTD